MMDTTDLDNNDVSSRVLSLLDIIKKQEKTLQKAKNEIKTTLNGLDWYKDNCAEAWSDADEQQVKRLQTVVDEINSF
jgi:hypothetical protein